jgi:hypothetical protein
MLRERRVRPNGAATRFWVATRTVDGRDQTPTPRGPEAICPLATAVGAAMSKDATRFGGAALTCYGAPVMTGNTPMLRAAIAACAALYLLAAAVPAYAETDAQKEAEAQADAQEKAKRAETEKEAAAKAPPPAIPGAVSSGEAAPASKNAAEMSPNDALFDAINRGDSAGARDAISRGAQLDARNVLGQTPTDAAIEADRNDITFMLLSLRGAVGSGTRPPVTQAAMQMPASAGRGRHHGGTTHARLGHGSAVTATSDPNPGTPNPAIGFNGF